MMQEFKSPARTSSSQGVHHLTCGCPLQHSGTCGGSFACKPCTLSASAHLASYMLSISPCSGFNVAAPFTITLEGAAVRIGGLGDVTGLHFRDISCGTNQSIHFRRYAYTKIICSATGHNIAGKSAL